MSGFVSRAACHGRRPIVFASYAGRQRSGLSTRLLKNRSVARFIVAPGGYGKTSVAIEYAETMFSWVHVFWINGTSPCFIRDVDAGDVASSCFAVDEEAALVVFDDVPALDPVRAERFSAEIDALLAGGCEVIVTCAPSACMIGGFQLDREQLMAVDLLLTDEELDASRTADERARHPAETIGPARRVPTLVWPSGEGAVSEFARSILYEEVPSDVMLLIASALVMGTGTISDIHGVMQIDRDALLEVVGDYPHAGFDDALEFFEASPLDVEALSVPLKSKMADLVKCSKFDSSEQLVFAWARVLMRAGCAERACDLVRLVCPRKWRSAWLIDNAYDLIRQACFYPVLRIARDHDASKGVTRRRITALESICRRVLGDEEGALRCAKRHAFDEATPLDARMVGLLVCARLATGPHLERVYEELETLAYEWPQGDMGADAVEGAAAGAYTASGHGTLDSLFWRMLAQAQVESRKGPAALAAVWEGFHGEGASPDGLCLMASWLFGLLDPGSPELVAAGSAVLHPAETFVRDRVASYDEGPIDYFMASAGLSMEEARMRGVSYGGGPLSAGILVRLRQVEMSVLVQRQEFQDDVEAERARLGDWVDTHPDSALTHATLDAPRRKRAVPILKLRMFGRFEVTIGDELVEQRRFGRQSARVLLVLLAVNQGRDLSRESIASTMWPGSPDEVRRKNFYTVWSHLRRALTLADGTCPYLLRHQYGCSLETRYVQSDIARLSEICREFMFGAPNIEAWSVMFSEIDSDFSSELMPAERKNPLILRARIEYRTRLVDALVAATFNAIAIDAPQWGIWFGRTAVNHDETREDAYAALMRAQVASNQRTAAMSTFLKCRRVLSERLGIDPSPEIVQLYESLLDSE